MSASWPPPVTLSAQMDLGSAVAGGVLVALSSTAMLALTGKISGISGIMHSWLTAKNIAHKGWRVR